MAQTKYAVQTTYELTTPVCCDKMFHGELPTALEITSIDGQYNEEVMYRYCTHCGAKADYDVVRTRVGTFTQPSAVVFSEMTIMEEDLLKNQWEYTKCDFALLVSRIDMSAAEEREIEYIDSVPPVTYFDGMDDEDLKRPSIVVVLNTSQTVGWVYQWKYADSQEVDSAILDIVRCLKC